MTGSKGRILVLDDDRLVLATVVHGLVQGLVPRRPGQPEDGKGAHPWDGCPDAADPARRVVPWGPSPKQAVKVTRGEIKISEEILFRSGSATIEPASQELLRSIGRVVRDEGMSAIIVEQNPKLILPITQRAVVLDRGAVVHEGDSEALLADPDTLDKWLAVAGH